METIEIKISKGQKLSEVLPAIETNTIINKTICGCGATTLELNTPRHSVIIEPNLPVILGKKEKHDFLFGVYEGVSQKDIEKYLYDNYNDGFYKIMTTPESFIRVKRAIWEFGMSIHRDFFILFDECDKSTLDVGYRKTIILPVSDFFKAENKAMVSATPIIIEDPRFEEQNFRIVKIVPTYDYRQDLTLIPTNNVYTTLRKYLADIPEGETVCFFHNSTNGIDRIIEHLDIKNQSNIYCSADSRDKLIERGYKNVSDKIEKDGDTLLLNRYNFFTSRFYSAVDIELPYKPIVIMVTEVFYSSYSTIDPATEAIQIAGRFRNGISKLVHITNYNSSAKTWSREKKERFLTEQHSMFSQLFRLRKNPLSYGERYMLNQALSRIDYAEFALPSGERNMFMYNNAFREEEIKRTYLGPSKIEKGYLDTEAFNVNRQWGFFATTDKDRSIVNPPKYASRVMLNDKALWQMDKLLRSKDAYDMEYLKQIVELYPAVYRGLVELGLDGMKSLENLKDKTILDAVRSITLKRQLLSPEVIKEVYKAFRVGSRYSLAEINEKLMGIYDRFEVKYKESGCANRIPFYFLAEESNKEQDRGWLLQSRIY